MKMEWDMEEDVFLARNISSMSYREIALRLGRTKESVAMRAKRLGLSGPKGKTIAREIILRLTKAQG
jgi:hypothetical protein